MSSAHAAIAHRQPNAVQTGTVKIAARAAPPVIDVVAADITLPWWAGKSRRTTTGRSTLPAVIASPIPAVAMSMPGAPVNGRAATNTVSSSRLRVITRFSPNRRATPATTAAPMPKQNTGSEVSSPATVGERSSSCWMSGRTAAREVIGERRHNPVRMIAATPPAARQEETSRRSAPIRRAR